MKNNSRLDTICVLPKSPKRIENQPVQFHSALAHELRNPLTSIILSTNELATLVGENEEARIYLDIITRSIGRINKVVSMLVKLNAYETIEREKYSIHQLLEEVLEMAGDRIRLKHIAVCRNFQEQDYKPLINVEEMKLALTNIIINALDAMTMDTGHLTIVTRSLDGKFIIQIEDNGCGISKENLKNIFKPYFTNKPGGLGIGLASTCNILRSHDVGINVKSREGKGTSFNLLFDKRCQQAAVYAHRKK